MGKYMYFNLPLLSLRGKKPITLLLENSFVYAVCVTFRSLCLYLPLALPTPVAVTERLRYYLYLPSI